MHHGWWCCRSLERTLEDRASICAFLSHIPAYSVLPYHALIEFARDVVLVQADKGQSGTLTFAGIERERPSHC